jgi:hypothetical protein
MKSKNILSVLLSLILATPQALLAQQRQPAQQPSVPPHTVIDLNSGKYTITSIIYSSTTGQALVGILDKSMRPLATFLECEAPQGPLHSSITAKDLSNCYARRGRWFEANEKNLAMLDQVFATRLQANFANAFKNDVEQASNPNIFLGLFMTTVGVGLTVATSSYTADAVKARSMGRIALGGVATVVAATLTLGSLFLLGSAQFGGRKVPALEDSMMKAYTQLLKEQPATPVVEFKPAYWTLTFSVLTESIFEAIWALNQA